MGQEGGPGKEVVDLEGASFYPTTTQKRGRRQTTALPLIRFSDYLNSQNSGLKNKAWLTLAAKLKL